ncbi:MAG TPA: hypothetical protein VKU36_00150 [Candidatus Babeliales bacterium]|nr:hypothetical protein [Candidatus Babeliales bacterium]
MKRTIAIFIRQLSFCIVLFPLPGCVHRRHIDRQKLHIDLPSVTTDIIHHSDVPPITIWIHGTLIIYTPSYHKIFNNKSVLLPINQLPENHHFRMIAETISEHDAEHFPKEEFYIFGWSGKLKNKEREHAAQALYHGISTLVEQYEKKYGCAPTIRIIAHSHGGNVALNMARLRPSYANTSEGFQQGFVGQAHVAPSTHPFHIKSLILLACPVQEKTMHLICTPLFERVYSLYSSFDIIQILAPEFKQARTAHLYKPKRRQYRYKLLPFSSRVFPTYSHLTQAKIKINNHPLFHTQFSRKEFVQLLPTILHKLDSWHDQTLAQNSLSKHKLLCVYHKFN